MTRQEGKCNTRTSWRDDVPIHPAANLFPMMSRDELRELGEDIKAHGLQSPLAVVPRKKANGHWTYQLLDGRNRLDAMELDGVPFKLYLAHGSALFADVDELAPPGGKEDWPDILKIKEEDALAYVISANIRRRHLSTEQKRALIAELLKEAPEKSNRQIAKIVGRDDKTVGAVRDELEGRAEIPHVATHTDSRGRRQPAHKPPQQSGDVSLNDTPTGSMNGALNAAIDTGVEAGLKPPNRSAAQLKQEAQRIANKSPAVEAPPDATDDQFCPDDQPLPDDEVLTDEQVEHNYQRELWQDELKRMAREAIGLEARFTNWKTYAVLVDIAGLVRQAAAAWTMIADHLAAAAQCAAAKKPEINTDDLDANGIPTFLRREQASS